MSRNSYSYSSVSRNNPLQLLDQNQREIIHKLYQIIKGSPGKPFTSVSQDNDIATWSTNRYFNSKIKENHISLRLKNNEVNEMRIAVLTSIGDKITPKKMSTLVYQLSKIHSIEKLHMVIHEKLFSEDSDHPTVLRFRLSNLIKFKFEVSESKKPNYHYEIRFEDAVYERLNYFSCSSFPRNFRNLTNSFFTKFPNLKTLSLGMNDPMHMINGERFLKDLMELLGQNNPLQFLILSEFYYDLPENIANCSNLVGVSIANQPVDKTFKLPDNFKFLSKLRLFDLWRYDLQEFPSVLLDLVELTTIQIVHSSISKLPHEISNLQKLRELVVVNAQLTGVPSEIARVSTITFLDFENNQIEKISPIFFEKNIRLNMRNNPHQGLETTIHGFERIAGNKIKANMDFHPSDSKEYVKHSSTKAFRRKHRQLMDNY